MDVANRNTVPLKDSAEIVRAPLFKHDPTHGGEPFFIVSIKDFPVAGLLPQPNKEILLSKKATRAYPFHVKPWDVLLTIVGTIGKVTIVPEHTPENWIPATNMLRIRFRQNPRIEAIAFYAWCKSTVGSTTISRFEHGTSIPIVTKGQISSMRIPVVTDEIYQRTSELWTREQELYSRSMELMRESQSVYRRYFERKPNPYLIEN